MGYKVNDIVPVDDQILVQLDKSHKVNTVSESRTPESLEKAAEMAAKGEEYVFQEEDFIKEKVKVNARFRTGVIVSVPNYRETEMVKYEVGQRVVFEDGNQLPLDLLCSKVGDEKCPVLIRKMHVRGIVK